MGCYNSVVIYASAEEVWNALRNFHDLSWSQNIVQSSQKVGMASGEEPGAKRILNDAFHETLLEIDHESRSFKYSIDDGPGPVSKDNVEGYVGTVSVFSVTENNTTFVEWTSKWRTAKDEKVAEFCNPIYHGLLQDLKKHFQQSA